MTIVNDWMENWTGAVKTKIIKLSTEISLSFSKIVISYNMNLISTVKT